MGKGTVNKGRLMITYNENITRWNGKGRVESLKNVKSQNVKNIIGKRNLRNIIEYIFKPHNRNLKQEHTKGLSYVDQL